MAINNPIPIPALTAKQIARFMSHVVKGPNPDDCWVWTKRNGTCSDGIYAGATISHQTFLVHRVAYAIAFGDPGDILVLHSCDNPPCVRPDHLFLGTHADNSSDMAKKGRAASGDSNGMRINPDAVPRGDRNGARLHPERLARGEKNAWSKLTEADVIQIRELRGLGWTYSKIAKLFNVSSVNCGRIVLRQLWKHVP